MPRTFMFRHKKKQRSHVSHRAEGERSSEKLFTDKIQPELYCTPAPDRHMEAKDQIEQELYKTQQWEDKPNNLHDVEISAEIKANVCEDDVQIDVVSVDEDEHIIQEDPCKEDAEDDSRDNCETSTSSMEMGPDSSLPQSSTPKESKSLELNIFRPYSHYNRGIWSPIVTYENNHRTINNNIAFPINFCNVQNRKAVYPSAFFQHRQNFANYLHCSNEMPNSNPLYQKHRFMGENPPTIDNLANQPGRSQHNGRFPQQSVNAYHGSPLIHCNLAKHRSEFGQGFVTPFTNNHSILEAVMAVQDDGERTPKELQKTPGVQDRRLPFRVPRKRHHVQSGSTAAKKYCCDVCSRAFSRSNTLVTHKRIHTGEKPFECEKCGRAFRQPGNLTRHELTHTTIKPYVCAVCKKAFNRASNLDTHMRTHTEVQSLHCPYCSNMVYKELSTSGNLPSTCSGCGHRVAFVDTAHHLAGSSTGVAT